MSALIVARLVAGALVIFFAVRAPVGDLRLDVSGETVLTVRALYAGVEHDLDYRLEVVREGAAGRSQSHQSGTVGLDDTLAVSTVTVDVGDRVTIGLALLRGEAVLEEVIWSQTIGTQ